MTKNMKIDWSILISCIVTKLLVYQIKIKNTAFRLPHTSWK